MLPKNNWPREEIEREIKQEKTLFDPTNFLGSKILNNYLNYEISSHSLITLLSLLQSGFCLDLQQTFYLQRSPKT